MRSSMKAVRLEDVQDMMEQMLSAPVFLSPEKRMLRDENRRSMDPNLIMDERHRILRESLPVSPRRSTILEEARRLILDEESEALYSKREERLLATELKKFQRQLNESRPKFCGPYTCSRKILASSDDEQFWKGASYTTQKEIDKLREEIARESTKMPRNAVNDAANEENAYPGQIIVTIKDKPISELKEQKLEVLRRSFETLKQNAAQERRFRELKAKVREMLANRRLQRCFQIWRTRVENAKTIARRKKESREISKERKIELFINAISEQQKMLAKLQKSAPNNEQICRSTSTEDPDDSKKKASGRRVVVEPPARNRLNAQKRIIAEQRAKLVEQNRIIEEMRLKQIETDTRKASNETINAAKEALTHCGQRTRRTLIQLMREEGCRDKSLVEQPRLPSPPRFLVRMEARAEARRERVRQAEEERQKKLEERRRKEELARKAEEAERKRLQQEVSKAFDAAQKEARRLREEQEQRRVREAERNRKLNQTADEFYRKYLLRRYIMEPFSKLIEMKYNYMKTADHHYKTAITRKAFAAWRMETLKENEIKLELAVAVYNRNLLWYLLREWKEFTKSETQKYQVAADFYDLRLQEKCLKTWRTEALESKITTLENIEIVREHYRQRLIVKYFIKWRQYPLVAKEMKDRERRKDRWRELVQRVIPDFDPKQRGVAIGD